MIRAAARPLVLVLAAALLGACGGQNVAPTQTAGGPGATTGAPPGVVPAACTLLTDADLEELTGATVVSKDDNVADTVYANHCRWTVQRADGGTGSVDLGILTPKGREVYDHSGGTGGLQPIDGLTADDAGLDTTTGSIFAVRGDMLVDVFTLSLGLSTDEAVALMRRALERLDGSTAPAGTAGAVGNGSGSGAEGDPCDLLTDQEILDVTGLPAVGKESTPRIGLWDAQCIWEVQSASGVPAALTVTIKSPGGRAAWDQYLPPIQGELTMIDGLGDAAFGKAHWPTHVLVGDTYVSVQFLDFPDPEGPVSSELARRVVEKLGG